MFKSITVKGSRYKMGFSLGSHFKSVINEKISKYEDLLKDEKIHALVLSNIEHVKKEFPECLEELNGKADGAGVNREALFLMHSSEIYKEPLGCTTAILKKDDRVLFSHNEDEQGYNANNTCLVKYDYGDHYLVSFTLYDQLTGSCYGYNSHGLVFSCNYIFHDNNNTNNISRYILTRELVECKTIDECINFLKVHKSAQPFSFNVLDIHTNEVINIENDFDDMYITHIDDRYARSNHFLTKENAKMSENSMYRAKFSKERIANLDSTATIDDVHNVLCYEDEEYVKSILMDPQKYPNLDNSLTISNMSFDSKTKEVTIYDYLDHSHVTFNMDDYI